MPPLSTREMSSILSRYEKLWLQSVPEMKCLMMSESGGHAALMSLVLLYHERRPTLESRPLQVDKWYVLYMNGLQAKILGDLQMILAFETR